MELNFFKRTNKINGTIKNFEIFATEDCLHEKLYLLSKVQQ